MNVHIILWCMYMFYNHIFLKNNNTLCIVEWEYRYCTGVHYYTCILIMIGFLFSVVRRPSFLFFSLPSIFSHQPTTIPPCFWTTKNRSVSPKQTVAAQGPILTIKTTPVLCVFTSWIVPPDFWIRVRWPRVANVPGVTKGWWFRSSRNPGSNHPTPSKADHLHNSTVFSPPREYFFSSALGTSSTDAKVEWVRSMNMVLKRIATLSTYHRGIGQ